MEDLSAMGQVEPNLDRLIAMLVQRHLWTLQRIPKRPLNTHQVVRLGTAEVGQAPQANVHVGEVVLRPLREQHDHIVAGKPPLFVVGGWEPNHHML